MSMADSALTTLWAGAFAPFAVKLQKKEHAFDLLSTLVLLQLFLVHDKLTQTSNNEYMDGWIDMDGYVAVLYCY